MVGALGVSIPEDTQHAVSVSLPTWKANVGYEEGEEWVVSKMATGYPRFFIHKSIRKFADSVLAQYGRPNEGCLLFPSTAVASRCRHFIKKRSQTTPPPAVRVLELATVSPPCTDPKTITPNLCAVFFPTGEFGAAKQFWQHSGEGLSSRRAEFCQLQLDEGSLIESSAKQEWENRRTPGPKRYSKGIDRTSLSLSSSASDIPDTSRFVEERFGRNLDISFGDSAKLAVRRRIAGVLLSNVGLKDALEFSREPGRNVEGFTENDVYLYPAGMSAIFNAHRILMSIFGEKKSVCYGFPYIDTLKILQKFGPGCYFYGVGASEDLDDVEKKLNVGESILALFCEFPSNPLLKSPDLRRIRALADKHNFAVVIDETVGNFLNVHVLPYADMVVSSLTKIFSGDSNVMGGSMVLNPKSIFYSRLKISMANEYEDNMWAEDALFLERNSRDFVSRIDRVNLNAEAVCDIVVKHPRIKQVYYPKYSSTRPFYDACRCPNGGYGGLLSITFHSQTDAAIFFDALETAKGPSLGTNFTLSSPYTVLAHYGELDWAAQFGVDSNLVRVSVGLEETSELTIIFENALKALESKISVV